MLCWLMAWAAAHAIDGAGWLSMGGAGSTPTTAAAHGSTLSPSIGVAMSDAIGGSERDYWASAAGAGTFTAENPAQGLSERFSADGVRVASGPLRVAMQLRSLGYGSHEHALAAVAPSAAANGVRYLDGTLVQSYANGPAGLEQSFTLARALPGAGFGAGAGPLALTLTLAGDARATLGRGGQTLTLAGAGRSLRYGGLLATDAAGRRLSSRMSLHGSALRLQVDTSGARYPIRIDPLIEQPSKLVSPEAAGTGEFGYSVALSANGSEALVGAPEYEKGRGAVWAFTRSGSTWVQQGEALIAIGTSRNGRRAGGRFGYSVALSGDGSTALIGAPREGGGVGAAWVFVLSHGEWVQGPDLVDGLAEEEATEAHLGKAVALSADGDTALVGGPGEEGGHGAVWSFTRSPEGESWGEGSKLPAPKTDEGEGLFGSAVALSADGETALAGAPGERRTQGAAWVFSRSEEGTEWGQPGSMLSGVGEPSAGRFGSSVALSGDGTTALVGGSGQGDPGYVWAFERTSSSWEGERLSGEEAEKGYDFGASVSLSQDGDTALIGGPADGEHQGAAWLWVHSGGSWLSQGKKLTGGEESGKGWFGESVALSANGEAALIGGPRDSVKVGAVWELFASAAPPPPPPPPPPAPTVTAVTPSEGPEAGDTEVTIVGSGFTEGASVTIGSAARDVQVLGEDEIKAVTSETTAGSYPVVVHDSDGTSSGGPLYRYTVPPAPPGTNTNTNQSSSSASGGVLGVIERGLPAPVLGVSGNIAPISGKVSVELPGSSVFVPLTQIEQVPFGTIVNATEGKVEVTTMGPHGLQTMYFYGGEFKLVQHKNGMVVAILTGGDFQVCPTKRERAHIATAGSASEASASAASASSEEATASAGHASGKHVVRKLWSSGHGSYSTKGNYASGAVLGTVWLTEDRCDGTEIFVATDEVAVTNLVNHRHRVVHAGHLYFAKVP